MYARSSLLLAGALIATGLHANASADPIKFMRDPHVSGNTIAFAYHGDIWLADANGANPRRLTSHVARDVSPRFSPDGRWVAFSSNRMGNYDIYVVPAAGGEPEQLTFHNGDDQVEYWTPDGRGIVFATSRGTHPFGSPLYIVPRDGGLPTPMPMDFARAGMIKQDGSMVAFNRENFGETRKGYKGNNSAEIWVQDLRSKKITQLTDLDVEGYENHVQDGLPMWGADGLIYFVSERDGIFNIWRIAATGGAPQQVTRHRTGGVRYPAISADGRTIIYSNEFELYTLEVPNGQPRKVPIELTFDPTDNLVEFVTTDNRADGFSPSPNGDNLAVDFHGEIFIVPSDAALGDKTQVTRSARRERFQEYSPDGKMIAYISDEGGEEELWVYEIATGSRRKLTRHDSYKSNFVWAPDASRIAFTAANRLFEVDVRAARTTELSYNPAGGFQISEYSSDGKWLVYTRSDDDQNSEVYLYDIAAKAEHNVSQNPFRDSGGRLTADGKMLVFTSARDGGVNHLFAVTLARKAEDPDDPLVRARQQPRRERPDSGRGGGDATGRGGDTSGSTAQAAVPIRIDLQGIEDRAIQLTTGTNAVGSFFLSRDGRTIYFTSSDTEGPALFSIGIDGRDRRRVVAGSFPGITPTADRRMVFFRGGAGGGGGRGGGGGGGGGGGEVFKMTLASNPRREPVTFSFPVEIDVRQEWAQIFDESWRVMRYRFYDEKMHGKDWKAIRSVYEPLLQHVGTYEDVYDLANQMIGELNASHVGVSGPPSRQIPSEYRTRYLGFEIEPADGRYRISHIYRDGPADKEWLGLSAGDYVLAIDNQELKAGDNYWKLLNHTINEYVPVKVAKSAAGDAARTVRIRTVTSLTDLKYEEWVAKNREFVEKESGGQIAYVHIRAMNQPSLARFQNEINQFWNKKGIVVDIRYNGGGNIDQELIDILEREPYQFWNSRWGARTWGRRPRQAIAGPKVMLINARSGSDSEVTPMGFRQLGLGRIVGNPTAAAVIATGSYALINGGSIRTPGSLVITWDPSKPNNYGINLENYGVPPDVFVENTPEDELRGFDRELKAAVDEALKMLREGRWQYTTPPNNGSGNDARR
jgi:tricorn protease